MFKFLNGLNEFYQGLRTHIILMKPFPTLDQVYNMVLREETQKRLQALTLLTPNVSTMAINKSKSYQTCPHCGKVGHKIENCF